MKRLTNAFCVIVPDEQLNKVYQHVVHTMDSLLIPKILKLQNPIHESAWQVHLGDTDMYAEYMRFFDRQILCHGVDNAMKQYYYNSPLAHSVGSHRLPVAHLALGVKYNLNELIAQALAYLVTTFQDSSFLKSQPASLCNSGYLTAYQILTDQVRVDPRFGATHDAIATNQVDHQQVQLPQCKKVFKHTKELLQTYTYLWKVPDNVHDALNELRLVAAHMMISPVKSGFRRQNMDMGTGGTLLNTINAIDILYPNNSCPRDILLVQFLNVICYYIALGRPNILGLCSNNGKHKQINEYATIQKMIDSNKIDTVTVSALLALKEAQTYHLHPVYSKVSNYLQ
ncbi:ATP synthase F0 subcomplex subunit OSCP atp5 [Mucor velutinosus]|uniref:ATP synthase F0 subcomplex subunit OSCP atp5 n=1 Tax=Mucor velutinosus TaxID=708070 RepID=A0AAN7DG69_9FUNG|nr:ATP synthase F0 subcomplex subunit OSCP atp5 [Mucor velutinosus]